MRPSEQTTVHAWLATAAVIALSLSVAGCGSGGTSATQSANGSSSAAATSTPSAGEVCITAWNAWDSALKGAAEGLAYVGGTPTPTYVSAGPSASFPDRCLITFAQADLPNGGLAIQYLEQSNGSFQFLAGDIPVPSLSSATTTWIAQGDTNAHVTMGPP